MNIFIPELGKMLVTVFTSKRFDVVVNHQVVFQATLTRKLLAAVLELAQKQLLSAVCPLVKNFQQIELLIFLDHLEVPFWQETR